MKKQVNEDFKNLMNWLNANKIYLNISKTEVILNHHKNLQMAN